jgi:hypothetical protein
MLEEKDVSLRQALLRLILQPRQWLLLSWNWKAALLSSWYRGSVFFAVNLHWGWRAAGAAMLTEFALRSVTAGFYGAMTQNLSRVRPFWQRWLVALVALPVLQHSVELGVHWARGTPGLLPSVAASAAATVLSTAFNLFAMRRGFFVVGQGAKSLGADLARLPELLGVMLAAPLRALAGRRFQRNATSGQASSRPWSGVRQHNA